MELTKKALEDIKFRTRGRWYSAEQVDEFLEEMAVAAEEAERNFKSIGSRLKKAEENVEALREENVKLWKENERLKREAKSTPKPSQTDKLLEEREQLLQDIKALKLFRERFQSAVESDAAALNAQIKEMKSKQLL